MIPKSCRLFGQDHAAKTKSWSRMNDSTRIYPALAPPAVPIEATLPPLSAKPLENGLGKEHDADDDGIGEEPDTDLRGDRIGRVRGHGGRDQHRYENEAQRDRQPAVVG